MKSIATTLLIVGLLGGTAVLLLASAPHPGVIDLIREGTIDTPYYLKNLHELRRAGVDNPFVTRQSTLPKGSQPFETLRAITTPEDWNILVILIDFSDKPFQVEPAFFDSLIFDSTYTSVRDYYREVSYGNLDLVTVNLPSQVGWVRAENPSLYYTTDSQGNPHGGFGAYPRNAQKLVEEAILAADPFVNYSDYDNDRNGWVDGLLVLHAGTGGEAEGDETNIWSHYFVTSDPVAVESPSDHIYAYEYAIVPEYWLFDETRYDMTIGVIAHELGHSLFGLPDLYDRDNSSYGLGTWSLMASGSWTGPRHIGGSPSHPDAWSRTMMGFATPQNVSANILSQSIAPVEFYPQIFKLWTDGKPGKEYFLVEHRMNSRYDQYLSGQGLLVYHIDENVDPDYDQNRHEFYPGYTDHGHYLVALEQADGEYGLEKNESSDGGDPFPGTALNTHFSNTTSPTTLAYDGTWTNVAITEIADLDTGIIANLIIDVPQESLTGISISDIPLDEGGQVSVSWRSIASDHVDSTNVSGYSIWLQDNNLVYIGNQSILPYDGGQWIHRLFKPATGDTLYRVTAQTLIDSNSTGFNKSKFLIAALSGDSLVIALSAVFEGYSVDNLPPLPPLGLSATYIGDTGVQLTWESSLSTDLGEYRVYRGESSEFMPTHVDSFLAFTPDTVYIDTSPDSATPFYRVTALDINGNVSNFTAAIEPDTLIVANAGHTGLPMAYRLYQNFPNPFNPVTTIRFDLPIASYVRILVFDLQAREIRRLIDDWLPAGQHLVRWDGRLNDGRMSSAGVYILRLETPYFVGSRKMVLLK